MTEALTASRARKASRRLLPPLPHRAMTLPLIGGVLGLAAASLGLFHFAPQPATRVPPGYVAMVNGRPILMSDFINQVEGATGGAFADATPAQRQAALDEMINDELMVQRGLALNVPETDTDVRTAIGDSVNSQAAQPVLAIRPTDDQLRAYFRAHLTKYRTDGSMRFRDLALHYGSYQNTDQTLDQAESDAAEAVFQLRSGTPLDQVMQHFGFVNSGNSSLGDSEFDFAARIHLGPKVFAAASALSDGQISDPVADKDGVHVIIMEQRQPPVFSGFDSVRNNVYSDYVNDEQKRAQQENLQMLRQKAVILVAPGQ